MTTFEQALIALLVLALIAVVVSRGNQSGAGSTGPAVGFIGAISQFLVNAVNMVQGK